MELMAQRHSRLWQWVLALLHWANRWRKPVVVLLLLWALRRRFFSRKKRDPLRNRKMLDKNRRKSGTLMPPYPNAWYLVARSCDIKVGDVKPKSAFGREIVMFRGEGGQVGVLDAFCPHLGTHLGYGGYVKKDCVVCPYHSWTFQSDGKCVDVPYCDASIERYSQIDAKRYHVRELLGLVYVWFHVDWSEPEYELDCLEPLRDFSVVRQEEPDIWDMHIMEMSQNSADYYHFFTTHHSLPYTHGFVQIEHSMKSEYGANGQPHVAMLKQGVKDYSMMGIRVPAWLREGFQPEASVLFFGPSILLFRIQYASYHVTTVMNVTPIEDLKQEVVAKTFISNRLFLPIGMIFHYMSIGTVNQDREVWEHKAHCKPMRLVRGDGEFVKYSTWLKQFYSENSEPIDLSW